ncbi:hypothetical protein FA15DRAFT_658556 [Coprinopsis marcescibilis]|uniref:Uncharacterized protein n=1 Tax=Coprinopsis marcescibilis TaxID=230819 RepID=A0A5C3KL86_COPMA|nr:hypothetical protein FA15DRAFT_658556 [Coprinopsis marcescibilis]
MPLFGSTKHHKEEVPRRTDLHENSGLNTRHGGHSNVPINNIAPTSGAPRHFGEQPLSYPTEPVTGQYVGTRENAYGTAENHTPITTNHRPIAGQTHHAPTAGRGIPPSGMIDSENRAGTGAGHGMTGKFEAALGSAVGSESLRAKGVQKQQEAAATKLQASELGEAERLEREAMMRRERAVAHGTHPDNMHPSIR